MALLLIRIEEKNAKTGQRNTKKKKDKKKKQKKKSVCK
jgi:hypothetical protein